MPGLSPIAAAGLIRAKLRNLRHGASPNCRITWVAGILLLFIVYPAWSQSGDDSWQYNRNYFDKDSDPQTAYIVNSVETWHLGKTFWKSFSEARWDAAIGDLNFVLQKVPNHPKALEILGSIAEYSNNPTLPFPYFKKAITLFPNHPFTLVQFGDYLERVGQTDEALSLVTKAITKDPNLAYAYAILAKIYSRLGKRELADEANRKAQELGFSQPTPPPHP
jgi:tetratricopeptide (TPR) repeat protein